jgi:hypothetical protein
MRYLHEVHNKLKGLCRGLAGDMIAMSKTIDMTQGKTHTTQHPLICIYRTKKIHSSR